MKRVYVGSDGGYFFGINVGFDSYANGATFLAGSPWPKYQHDLRNSGWAGGTWVY